MGILRGICIISIRDLKKGDAPANLKHQPDAASNIIIFQGGSTNRPPTKMSLESRVSESPGVNRWTTAKGERRAV